MKNDIIFNSKALGLWVWGVMTVLSVAICLIFPMAEYPKKAMPLVWGFFSWNFFAYAFDKDMWPWVFVELSGGGKGDRGWRLVWFWLAALLYGILLAAIAWAG